MPEACNFIKKETLAQVFSVDFVKFLRTPFFYRTPRVAASELYGSSFCSLEKNYPLKYVIILRKQSKNTLPFPCIKFK